MRKRLAIEPLDLEAGPELFTCREPPDQWFEPLFRRGMRLCERKKWSSLAFSAVLHCALACVFYSVARPHPPAPHNWIEVQLVGSCPSVAGDGAGPGDVSLKAEESEACSPVVHGPIPPSSVETAQVPEEKPVHTAEVAKSPQVVPVKKRAAVKKTAETAVHPPKEEPTVKPETPETHEAAMESAPVTSSAAGEGTAAGHGTSPGDGTGPTGHTAGPGMGGAQGGGPIEASFGSPGGPRFLKKMLPAYPPFARKQEMEGAVLLRVTINAEGRVVEVEVLKKAGFGFDEAAVKAIRESTFIPAKRDGKSLSCIALLPIRFELRSSDRE